MQVDNFDVYKKNLDELTWYVYSIIGVLALPLSSFPHNGILSSVTLVLHWCYTVVTLAVYARPTS